MKKIKYKELEEMILKTSDAEMNDFMGYEGGNCETVKQALKQLRRLGFLDESKIETRKSSLKGKANAMV